MEDDTLPTIVAIAIGVLLVAGVGIAVFFIFRKATSVFQERANRSFLFYSPTGKDPQVEDIYDPEGIPKSAMVNYNVVVQLHGASWVRTRELMEVLRRHLLIPVDISRNAGADPKQTFLMHPKKFASQLGTLVPVAAEQEFIRNITLAVLAERSVVQQPAQHAESVRHLLTPVSSACPDLAALFAQIAKVPQQQAANAEAFDAALRSTDRRTRFVALHAVSMLVFTRDNAPVSLKVVELVKKLDLDALLACCNVDPLAFAAFERAVKVRSPMGRPLPSPEDVAEDAVKRGFKQAVSATRLCPLQMPIPASPVPMGCLVDLFMTAKQLPFTATIVDVVLQHAVVWPSAPPSLAVAVSRMMSAFNDGKMMKPNFPLTAAAVVKAKATATGTELSEEEEKMVSAAEDALRAAAAPDAAGQEGDFGLVYPGDAKVAIEQSAPLEPVADRPAEAEGAPPDSV